MAERIMHKELLAFSNLTNLEWEFVDLKEISNSEEDRRTTQLDDLLTPEVFVRRETDPDTGEEKEMPVYSEGELGRAEMRVEAGIAMEYVEKSDDGEEGEFLKDWEVIYGADKYKIIADYLDERWKVIADNLEEDDFELEREDFASEEEYRAYDPEEAYEDFKNKEIYDSRDEYEEFHEEKIRMEFRADLIDGVFKIVAPFIPTGDNNHIVEVITKKVFKDIALDICSQMIRRLTVLLLLFYSPKDLSLVLSGAKEDAEEYVKERIKTMTEQLENNKEELQQSLAENETGIMMTEVLDLYDRGRYEDQIEEFRVLALKKDDEIVIAYKGEQLKDEKMLPDELDCLQMVHNQIREEHSDANITFTGFKGGADLSFINTLLANQVKEYQIEAGDTLWNIAEEIFGEGVLWDRLKDESGESFTAEEAEELQIEDQIQYRPAENDEVAGRLFYDEIKELKNCVNFTIENTQADYRSAMQFAVRGIKIGGFTAVSKVFSIIIKNVGNLLIDSYKTTSVVLVSKKLIASGLAGKTLFTVLGTAIKTLGVSVLVAIITYVLIDGIKQIFANSKARSIYNSLEGEFNFIESEKQGIKGYITDEFYETDYVELEARIEKRPFAENKTIKVKKADALFLIFNNKRNEIIYRENNQALDGGAFVVRVPENSERHYPFYRLGKIETESEEIYEIKENVTYSPNGKANIEFTESETQANPDLEDIEHTGGVYQTNGELTEVGAEKLFEGRLLVNLMIILGKMQRTYLDYSDEIFELIYPSEGEEVETPVDNDCPHSVEKIARPKIEVVQGIPEKKEKPSWVDDNLFNEFAFLPFIDRNTGDMGDELRKDYIASCIKSIVQKNTGETENLYNRPIDMKIENEADYQKLILLRKRYENHSDLKPDYQLKKFGLKQRTILSSMRIVNDEEGINGSLLMVIQNERNSRYFNYIKYILSELDSEKLEDYYLFKGEVEEEDDTLRFTATGIKMNLEAESRMEYKYNPNDYIIGGSLYLIFNSEFEEVEICTEENLFELMSLREDAEKKVVICNNEEMKNETDPTAKCLIQSKL